MILKENVTKYILKEDREKKDQTIFLIKEQTSKVSLRLVKEAANYDVNGKILNQDLNKTAEILIESCLVGWENLKNEKGEQVPFNIDNAYKLPIKVLMELVGAIDKISKPTEEEIKN